MRLIDEVPNTEFSELFTQGMYDRMAMSFYKYGAVAKAYPAKVDALGTLELKLAAYRASGNTELLMDVANYAMIEFMHPRHIEAHYQPTDSHAKHAKRVWSGGETSARRNDSGSNERFYVREGD